MKHRITTSSVRKFKPGTWTWDTVDIGWGLVLREDGTGTWIVQKVVAGRTRRVRIGSYPTWAVDKARARARELLVQMESGVDPNAEKRAERARGLTLREAADAHMAAMKAKRCSPRSIKGLDWLLERHWKDHLGRPLLAITKAVCVARHRKLTEDSGDYAANHAMRALRAVWATAARQADDDFPPCPVRAVTLNKESRRREPIPPEKLPAWRAAVDAIGNPIRRDLQLVILLTGLRSTDAATMRWADVDLKAATLHRPKPKGGRAFTVPVARQVAEILRARKEENEVLHPGCDWVWPTTDRHGKVTHTKVVREKDRRIPSPHRSRDTFASAAHACGVGHYTLSVLLNHRLPGGDVTSGYIRPETETLRPDVQRIADYLCA